MNVKHQTKNAISRKIVFLAAGIAIAIITAFSICATTEAYSLNVNQETEGIGLDQITFVCEEHEGIHDCAVSGWAKSTDLMPSKWESGCTMANMFEYAQMGWDSMKAKSCCCWLEMPEIQSHNKNEEVEYTLFVSAGENPVYDNSEITALAKISLKPITDEVWKVNNEIVPRDFNYLKISNLDENLVISFESEEPKVTGCNISGHVADADNVWQPVPGAFVQYCQWNPWFWDYVPVPEMSTFTDWFGNYTIEGVTEEMLPGVIRVYRFGYEVGESWPIWGAPEGEDTIYRFIEMAPSEPPVPPTPPTPPDPPVPPVPPQPDPPQPVPPTPVPPTPVEPGTNVPQTGDSATIALAIASMLALCGASATGACAKRRRFDK